MDVPEHGDSLRDPRRALRAFLASSLLALRARRLVEWSVRLLPWTLAAATLAVATLRLLHGAARLDARTTLVVALAALVAWLAGSLLAALAPRYAPEDVALLVDRSFGTHEVVATAAWSAGSPDAAAWADRALAAARGRKPREAFPLRAIPARRLLAAATGLAAVTAALLLPPPQRAHATAGTAPDTKILETLEELDTQLAEVAKTLEDRPAADTARQVLEDLQARVEELRQSPQSKEETLLALERLDQVAADASERRDTTASDAMKRALSSLEQAALTREAARAALDGDAEKLEAELKKLGEEFQKGGSFDEREVQRMAVRLQEAADALRQVGSAELADALEKLAKALEEGDMVEAARLTEELASSEELQQLMRELQGDEALTEAGELLQQALASMGRPRPDGKTPGQGDPARGGIPVDWGVGTTNEARPDSALGKRHQSDRQSAETSDWREAYEALAESQRLDGARGRSTRVQGQVGEGEFVAVPTRTVASGPQDAASPVVRVPARYEQAKEEALARDEVPAGYVDPVRRYFSQIGSGASKQAPAPAPAGETKAPAKD